MGEPSSRPHGDRSWGEVITINRAASEMLGYSLGAFEGKGWGDLFFDDEKNTGFNQIIIDIVQERRVNLKRSVSYIRSDGENPAALHHRFFLERR